MKIFLADLRMKLWKINPNLSLGTGDQGLGTGVLVSKHCLFLSRLD